MDKAEFQKLLDTHDWYYDSSDDMRVWTRGSEEERAIKLNMKNNNELYELYKAKRQEMFPHIKG